MNIVSQRLGNNIIGFDTGIQDVILLNALENNFPLSDTNVFRIDGKISISYSAIFTI